MGSDSVTAADSTLTGGGRPANQERKGLTAAAVVALALVALATTMLEVRPLTDVGERSIGSPDQANMAIVARNIAEGHGAVTDAVWLLHGGGPPGPTIRHPEGYWSTYIANLVALSFKAFGASRQSMVFVSSVVKVAIAFLAFWWVLHLTRRLPVAVACGVIVLVEPKMVASVGGLSDIYLAAGIFVSVVTLITAIRRESKAWWFICGAAAGAAIGMKPSGILLLGLIPALVFLVPRRRQIALASWPLVIGLTLLLTPLAIHNYRAGGTIFWPDAAIMRSTLLQMDAARPLRPFSWVDQATTRAWYSAAYDPESEMGAVSTWSSRGIRVHLLNFADFAYAWLKGALVPSWVLPFVLVGAVGWTRARLYERVTCRSPYEMFVAATLILTLGSCVLGAMVHYEGRYYLFLVPLYLVVGLIEADRLSSWLVLAQFVLVVGMGARGYVVNNSALATWNIAEYRVVNEILPDEAVVMTQNPLELTYHTRRPSVVLPYNGDYNVLREIAERFRVTHLVVLGRNVLHPELESLNQGKFPSFIEKLHESDNVIIGRMLGRDETPAPDPPTEHQ